MKVGINKNEIEYLDQHLSHFAQHIDYGYFGDVDVAIVEAAAITENGDIVLGSGVGNTPMLVKHAKRIIVEVNTSIPLSYEGIHDLYVLPLAPEKGNTDLYGKGPCRQPLSRMRP